MTRQLTTQGRNQGKIWEGLPGTNGKPALTAYQDDAGVWTIGWGHTHGVKKGDVITEAQAERFLDIDLGPTCDFVASTVRAPLTDNQFAALVWFCFNIGDTGFETSSVVRALNATPPRYDDVPAALALWNKITDPKTKKKVVSRGLVNRRALETTLWLLPDTATKPVVMPETVPTLTQSDLRQMPVSRETPATPPTGPSQTAAGKGNLATLATGLTGAIIAGANQASAVKTAAESALGPGITEKQFWLLASALLAAVSIGAAVVVYFLQRRALK